MRVFIISMGHPLSAHMLICADLSEAVDVYSDWIDACERDN